MGGRVEIMETQPICPSCRKTLPPGTPLGLCPECLIKSGFNTGTEPGQAGKGSGFVPPPVEEIRRLFPQLEIIELIGQGGMGAVYKARQPTLDRFVALKILPPGAAGDAGFAERFNREARALARLSHPHIVAVHDFGQTGGQPYLIMEFVDGANLRQVEQAGRLEPEQALQIVPQICEALQFAHNEGIVHRDIKPENILIDKKGRVKITDFGIAKILGVSSGKASLTGAKDVVGTPHYMAPEQVEHPQTVDHRADIYSLGVVFYEMLTGELPLGKFAPPSKKVHMDVRLDEVVLRTLEKEPELRYQQASEVKTQVETIATTPFSGSSGRQSVPSEARSQLTSVVTTPPRLSRTASWGAVLAVLFFVGLAITALLHWAATARLLILSPVRIILVLSPVWLLLLAAPFGTTILGWTAVSQIRRSAGRLYGLGLAVFDGLLFPLLALDAFIFCVLHALTGDVFRGDYLAIALLVSFVFDWRIAWWVWRVVNKSTGVSPASPGTPPAVSRSRSAGWTVARIVLLHAAALLAAVAFFAFIVPLFAEKFANWGAPLPKGTLIVLHFSEFIRHGGYLLVLALLAADLAVVLLLRRFVGRELVCVWAYVALVVFIIPVAVGMWGVFAPFTRVTTGITRAASDANRPVRGSLSRTTNNLSVAVFHENNATLRFAIFHAGNFKSALRGGSIGGNVHVDEGSIALPNGNLFVLRCESSRTEQLQINGREFDLHAGRVLVLRDDGHGDASVDQLDLFPPFSVARDPEALAQLIREQKRTTVIVANSNAVSFGPVIERVLTNDCAMDLDTGKQAELPEFKSAKEGLDGINEKVAVIATWMEPQGMDALFADEFTAYGMKVKMLREEDWSKMSPSQLGEALRTIDPKSLPQVLLDPTLASYAFQTREGGQGILQVLGNEKPHSVKLRYKLIQPFAEAGDTSSAPKPVTPTTTPGNTTAQTKLAAIKPLWDDAYVALMEKNDPTGAGARLNQALPAMDKLQSSLHGTEAARPIAVGIDQVRLVLEALNQGKVEQARTLMKSLNVSGPMFEGLITNSDALHQQPVLHEAGELQSPGEPGVNGTETPVPQAPQPVQRLSKGEYGQDFRMTFPLTPQGRFRLDNPNGTIEITGWDQNEVLVKGVKRGKKREAVEATKIDVDSGVDRVAVHTRVPRKLMGWGNGNVTVDYTIHVPRTARLEKIENANGNVVIEGVTGDIEASTANGSVRAKGSMGNLKLSTANGAVTAELASLSGSQSVSLDAANGSITAMLPPDANATVVADTSNGSITSEFPSLTVKKDGPNGSHVAGTLGQGGASIKAQIANGKITIQRSK